MDIFMRRSEFSMTRKDCPYSNITAGSYYLVERLKQGIFNQVFM